MSCQESQIESFIYKQCIKKKYPRKDYTVRNKDEVYFIVSDFINVGLIKNPEDERPLIISQEEIGFLPSLEGR